MNDVLDKIIDFSYKPVVIASRCTITVTTIALSSTISATTNISSNSQRPWDWDKNDAYAENYNANSNAKDSTRQEYSIFQPKKEEVGSILEPGFLIPTTWLFTGSVRYLYGTPRLVIVQAQDKSVWLRSTLRQMSWTSFRVPTFLLLYSNVQIELSCLMGIAQFWENLKSIFSIPRGWL